MSRRLYSFRGGLHLPDHKAASAGKPIAEPPLPKRLYLALQQHIGEPAVPIVAVGERVLKGQKVARAEGFVSAPVHASSSGTVVAIEEHPVPHPSGLHAPCIVIETDGRDEPAPREPVADYTALDPSALRNIIREAGIVGLGGAGFPAFIKLNPGPRTVVETLILNGAECEPYITCDDRLMRERAEGILAGAAIMSHALQARECVIAVEDNKPEAIAALCEAVERSARRHIEVVPIPTRYPAGGEKQLIQVITGKEVPSQGLPIDIGIVCHNVSTAYSIHRAVDAGEPLLSRVVTVSGGAVAAPGNFEVRLGTPFAELLEWAGGLTRTPERLVMGGPMMGIEIQETRAGTVKTTNCVLATLEDEYGQRAPVRACIRCGACAEVCPVQLLPQQLHWHARAKDFDKAQDFKLFDCIECGCCAYVCPSNLPLVHYYRYAKTEIWAQEREKKKADLARQRHEFRQARFDREQAEKAARMQQKKAAVAGSGTDKAADSKKAAIEAAMARAKAKKAEQAAGTGGELSEAQQQKLAEAKARHAARQTERAGEAASGGDLSEARKQKIAEAKARHAARQAEKAADAPGGSDLSEEQKRKLAEARARHAARQAEKAADAPDDNELSEEQKRKLAEARARHAARQAEKAADAPGDSELSEEQKRKLAEARARHAARQAEKGAQAQGGSARSKGSADDDQRGTTEATRAGGRRAASGQGRSSEMGEDD